MFFSLRRWLEARKRVKNWQTARDQYRRAHDRCAFCEALKQLEVHDVLPYHCIKDPSGKSVEYWLANFCVLCHHDHRMQGHSGDPEVLLYNPLIRELARAVTDRRHENTTWC